MKMDRLGETSVQIFRNFFLKILTEGYLTTDISKVSDNSAKHGKKSIAYYIYFLLLCLDLYGDFLFTYLWLIS